MNSRFKFRVWYKPYNGYVEKRDHLVLLSDGTLCEYDGIEIDSDNYIIEQCTGLKDKNGEPIFENDLIKTANYKTGLPEIYVVKWCAECGLYQLESTQSDQIIDMFRAEKGTIIGNIHEQKDSK